MKRSVFGMLIAGLMMISTQMLAHCEIPCGIYDDALRITMIGPNISQPSKKA